MRSEEDARKGNEEYKDCVIEIMAVNAVLWLIIAFSIVELANLSVGRLHIRLINNFGTNTTVL